MFWSMLGMVALSGIVVNASLVLVDYINRRRREGAEPRGCKHGGVTRCMICTSATTFIGLAPLIATANWATSFVIPMAIARFQVMFAP